MTLAENIAQRLKITLNDRPTAINALAKSIPSWWMDAIIQMVQETDDGVPITWIHPDDRPKPPKKAKKAKK